MKPTREDAWRALQATARAYAAAPLPATAEAAALSEAGKQWGRLNPEPRDASTSSGLVIPFGRSKGTPIGDATTPDLEWVAGALRRSVDDPTKARWRAQNEELLAAVEHELERR